VDCNRYLLTAGQRDLEESNLVKKKEQKSAQCSTDRNVRHTMPLALFSEVLYDIWSEGTFVHCNAMKKKMYKWRRGMAPLIHNEW
jgi:putative SOS response-associated peptidase YedK